MSFFVTDFNSECNEYGAESISSPAECQYAMAKLNENKELMTYKGEVFNGNLPKGCFSEEISSRRQVLWNHHTFGRKNIDARQLCVQNGKKYIEKKH